MSGFEDLEQSISLTEAMQPLTPEETAFADEDLSDEDALGIVLQDASTAITYLQSHNLMPAGVDAADDLVRAYVKPRMWADGKPRANMPMHVVLEAIEKILPILYMSLFGSGKRRPFSLSPLGDTKPAAARAKEAVLAWAVKQAGLKEEMRRSLKTVLTYGFMVGSWGWETCTYRQKVYEHQADGSVKSRVKLVTRRIPTYECLDLKNVLVDPACKRQDVQKGAGYVIKQVMIDANVLDELRDDPSYRNIPTRDELRQILASKGEETEDSLTTNKRAVWREYQAELDSINTSADPLSQPLELLEEIRADRVITVLQRKIVIRNEENEFGRLPVVSCAFVDVLGSAWGFGVARLLAGEQRLQQGVINNWIDALALILNPVYQLLKGVGAGTQNIPIAPGKVITEAGELKPLVTPDVTAPAMAAVETSEARAAKRVGSNGGSSMPDQAMRTGTGVQAFTNDVIQRMAYFLEIFIDMVYVPVLEAFLEMCMDKLQPEDLNAILGEQGEKVWMDDILDVYNAQTSVEVLAGTNLTAKAAAIQIAPQIFALMQSGPVQDSFVAQNKKFNYLEFMEEYLDLMGLDFDELIQEMTPEDQQRAQQMNQAAVRAQAEAQQQQQQHQNDLDLVNEKGTVQAGVALVKQAAKSHLDEAANALEKMNGDMGGQ